MAVSHADLQVGAGGPTCKGQEGPTMPPFPRRGFLAATLATGAVRAVPIAVKARKPRVILELVYDKGMGMMRAVERVVR